MAIAFSAQNLGKRYRRVQRDEYGRLTESLWNAATAPFRWVRGLSHRNHGDRADEFWGLRDFNIQVEAGEILGVIGPNGAGKSTLLKILSRVTEPTSGQAVLNGRVGCLLEVGTGFHQELSGRENVYLNGAILGMKRREINRKFDEIVGFAGVGEFIDTPVKRYSSGMQVRLAFAVAAHLEPEILIIDEVLAVGDLAFQTKCLGRINEVSREGRTVIFVSHNLNAVRALCTRCVRLDKGQIVDSGPPDLVVTRYEQAVAMTKEAEIS